MSNTISASCVFLDFFITLLINVPIDIRGNCGRLNYSKRSKDTDVLGDLTSVLTAS